MGSSAASIFSEGLTYLFFWWLIDGPSAAGGAYRGFISPLGLQPEVGRIKRTIPEMPWYLRRGAIMLLYGPLIFVTVFWRFPDIHSEAEFIWKLCHFKWHSLKNKNTEGSDRIIRIKTCTSPGGAKNQLNAKRTYMPNCQNCYTGLENDCSIHFYKKMAFYFWYYLILFDTDIWYLVPLNFM